jgi:hypothetical protein
MVWNRLLVIDAISKCERVTQADHFVVLRIRIKILQSAQAIFVNWNVKSGTIEIWNGRVGLVDPSQFFIVLTMRFLSQSYDFGAVWPLCPEFNADCRTRSEAFDDTQPKDAADESEDDFFPVESGWRFFLVFIVVIIFGVEFVLCRPRIASSQQALWLM